MNDTINTLLNNIQQPTTTNASSSSIPNMEEFTDTTITNLLNDISQMTNNSTDANPIIDTVMKQLLDKELMYTPMKEVCDRYPAWLAKNRDALSSEEYGRYGKQYEYFQRIVRVYEVEPGNFERLMELMQDIQE
jgi:peroxin-19